MNKKIWLISPYGREKSQLKSYNFSGAKSFEDVWAYDLSNNCIALGSSYASKPSGKSVNQIKSEILRNNKESYSERTCTMKARQLWSFYHEIKEGDIIVAKDGLKTILAIGKVFSKNGLTTLYSEEKGIERTNNSYNPHPNFLNVHWKEDRIDFGVSVFIIGRFLELHKAIQIKHRTKILDIINRRISDLWGDDKPHGKIYTK
jgi:hypothetical protein